jgi:hypothetical protein
VGSKELLDLAERRGSTTFSTLTGLAPTFLLGREVPTGAGGLAAGSSCIHAISATYFLLRLCHFALRLARDPFPHALP